MRKLRLAVFLMVLSVCIGCGGENTNPTPIAVVTATANNQQSAKAVVTTFDQAVVAGDWATADRLVGGNLAASAAGNLKNYVGKVTAYTVGEEVRSGATAIVSGTWQGERGQSSYLLFTLYQKNGT